MKHGTLVKLLRVGILLGIVGGLVVAGGYLRALSQGPRMRDQPHIRTFEAYLPPIPAGTVPVLSGPVLPGAEEAESLANPLEISERTVAAGRVYYGYYCLGCHGEKWDGHGPVGQSYMPVPTDLVSPQVQNYSDGKLLRAMLTGTGHEPVLQRVVPPEHWWYLAAFVRSLPAQKREAASGERRAPEKARNLAGGG